MWIRVRGARRAGRRPSTAAWGQAVVAAVAALALGATAIWAPGPHLAQDGAQAAVAQAGTAGAPTDDRAVSLLALGVPVLGAESLLRALEGRGGGHPGLSLWAFLGLSGGDGAASGPPAPPRQAASALPGGSSAVHAYPPSSRRPPNAVPPYPTPPPPDVYGRHPLVAIYHTDSTEAYLPAMASGAATASSAFSRDQAVGVVQVGAVLAESLYRLGVDNVHSRAVNDPDGMIGAYENSARTAAALLRSYPGVRILLDVHRAASGESAPAPKANGAAAVTLVVGTDDRLPDPHWRQNLAFAHVVAAAAERLYPDWPVRVEVSPNQYNQELSAGALLVQVGNPSTTLQSADRAARQLARVIAAVVQSDLYPGAAR
jgi:stage II sporulation protein P